MSWAARTRQYRFARDVLINCGDAWVFCGFKPASLPPRSGLLRASHIKPWAIAEPRERVDACNGVATCPLHDAAFDEGHITVLSDLRIVRSPALDRAIAADDPRQRLYFQEALPKRLILPPSAKQPSPAYLDYHRDNILVGDT